MRKWLSSLAWALVLAMAAAGCARQPATPSGPKGTAENPWVIGMSQCNLGEPWRVQMNADVEAAAKEYPQVKVIYKNAQNQSTTQQAQVREFMAQGVDLIIISPKEAKPLTEPVRDAYKSGIPVIVLDRKVEGEDYTCFIGADNVKIGREAGKFLVEILNGKGKIVELQGLMTSTPGQERHNGFMAGIKGSELKIIFSADCKWLEPDAQREMNSALARFPQSGAIDAVYAHNDPSAHGAYITAKLEGKGREKTIKFIGIDALPHEGVRYVRDGILTATFEYPTGGKEGIETALKILGGEEVPKNITLGTRIFTQDNVAQGGEAIE
ncbi:MAG: substrate-binding domain-containing protein [Armatimonadota bacterium]|nr:MAG: substrate-binding domain-containing protein [Armatimonadota bacterium]